MLSLTLSDDPRALVESYVISLRAKADIQLKPLNVISKVGGFSLLHLNLDHVWDLIFVSVAHFYFLSFLGIQV